MARTLRDVMTRNPVTLDQRATLVNAARLMREHDIGSVLVMDGEAICGIVTDRDLVVRGVAEDRDPKTTTVGEVGSGDVRTLPADAPIKEAIRLMREHALRRIPVVENDRPVGIVSIGDLAVAGDGEQALDEISAAEPNR
jgi:CBS domain-containing protein